MAKKIQKINTRKKGIFDPRQSDNDCEHFTIKRKRNAKQTNIWKLGNKPFYLEAVCRTGTRDKKNSKNKQNGLIGLIEMDFFPNLIPNFV